MKQITNEQRYQIEAYLKAKMSIEFIARELDKHHISIRREIKRNAQKRGGYNAKRAIMLADERKERYGRNRKFTSEIEKTIRLYIEQEQWSPEQIAGYCKKTGEPMVSHERIYQYIRIDKENGGDLYKNLRHKLKHRKRPVGGKFIPIKDRVSIDERPEAINNKERFGDWEIDTIIGKDGKGAIVTIVERSTAFFMMKNLPDGKNAESLAKIVIEMLLPYKKHVHSITADNGTEFADHKTIAHNLDLNFYFAHPYSSWERGLSEYTNKLIRQYIPKKSVFTDFSDDYILEKQYRINRRPREKLGFDSPKNIFYNLVA
jgi:IS30 family transposase